MLAHVQFVLICAIWSASFILMKKAHVALGPVTIAGLRAVLGAAVLWMLWHLVRRSATRWPLSRAQLPALLIPGLIGFAYPYVAQPHLIGKHQDSAYFGMMVALVPLVTIVVSIPMLGAWPRGRQVVGVVMGLACLAVLGGEGEVRGVPWYDFALAATVPLAYGVSNTFIRQRFREVPPLALTCAALAIAGLVMLPAGVVIEPVKPAVGTELAVALGALVLLGVVGSGLAMYMFYRLIQSHGPLFAGMVTYLAPVGALAWGWLDGEPVTAMQLASMAGILLAVALVQWRGAPRAPSLDEPGRGDAAAVDEALEPSSQRPGP